MFIHCLQVLQVITDNTPLSAKQYLTSLSKQIEAQILFVRIRSSILLT